MSEKGQRLKGRRTPKVRAECLGNTCICTCIAFIFGESFRSCREQWGSPDDACKQSLSLGLWLKMKADGSEQSEEAQHILAECVRNNPVENLELRVDEVIETASLVRSASQVYMDYVVQRDKRTPYSPDRLPTST